MVKLLLNSYATPEENLAFEAWYFEQFTEPTLRLWVNPTSVILGKHQNAAAQADLLACNELQVPVLRRISGGGTVFHDPGNVNFSFFRFADERNPIDYHENLKIIRGALAELGYEVMENERHDLYLGEYKISGNAQHHSKNKVLHHGTLLYDTDTDQLRKVIHHPEGKYVDKAVKSKRSPVCNLRSRRDVGEPDQFYQQLGDALSELLDSTAEQWLPSLPDATVSKYYDPEWNLGYGPKYTFFGQHEGADFEISVSRGGVIENIECDSQEWGELLSPLKGQKHWPDVIMVALESSGMSKPMAQSLLRALF